MDVTATTLNEGTEISLHPLYPGHVDAVVGFYLSLPDEVAMCCRELLAGVAGLRSWLQSHDGDTLMSIIAIRPPGDVIGIGTLSMPFRGWRRKLGEVRVTVHPASRRVGLGRALLTELTKMADRRSMSRLQALLLAPQHTERALVERLGFCHEATLRNIALDQLGNMHDLLIYVHETPELLHRLRGH